MHGGGFLYLGGDPNVPTWLGISDSFALMLTFGLSHEYHY